MTKFWLGVYVGASAMFIWGMFIELDRVVKAANAQVSQ